MRFLPDRLAVLRRYMKEREHVRILKDAGEPKPWTKDPMLLNYRFCNVRREDDAVTRWIKTNWRDPYAEHHNLYIAMILARLLNWPDTLEDIGFPEKWDYKRYLTKLQNRKMRGERLHTGAYMVTAGGRPIPKEEAICDMVHGFYRAKYRPEYGDSLRSVWIKMQAQGVGGMGSFIAAQVVADLKHTPLLALAQDWRVFCAPGPGSQNGLNWLLDRTGEWKQEEFQEAVNYLRGKGKLPYDLCAQDVQNNLCELSKYTRGFSRTKYPGAA